MRKRIAALLAVLMIVGCMAGCTEEKPADDTITTTTTVAEETDAGTTTAGDKPTGATKCRHTNTKDATCTDGKTCADCGKQMSAALGHAYGPGLVCTRCGEKAPTNAGDRVEVQGVKLADEAVELATGDTKKLTYTLDPKNPTDKDVTWSTSNAAVATVGNDGTVKAVSLGDAVITVTTKNGKTDTCKVKVLDFVLTTESGKLGGLNWDYQFSVDYSKSWNTLAISEIVDTYTKTGANSGTLTMIFNGEVNYSGAGSSQASVASVGWRLYNSAGKTVAEGEVTTTEKIGIGNPLVGMTATVPNVAPGRYRLELYSTHNK